METLLWLGLAWDEGPEVGGPHGPYIQSQRTDIYRKHADILLERGAAYWCTCTPERLAAMREQQRAAGQPTRYDRRCLGRQDEVREERAAGTPAVLRQLHRRRGARRGTTWSAARSPSTTPTSTTRCCSSPTASPPTTSPWSSTTTSWRSPTSSAATSGSRRRPSTSRLYAAFGWTPPRFAHVPAGARRGPPEAEQAPRRAQRARVRRARLPARRRSSTRWRCSAGRRAPRRRCSRPTELVERFSLDRVHDSAAVFDPKRLELAQRPAHPPPARWRSSWSCSSSGCPGTSKETRRRLVPLLQERMVLLRDATALAAPLLGDAPWDDDVVFPPRKVDKDTAIALLDEACAEVERGGARGCHRHARAPHRHARGARRQGARRFPGALHRHPRAPPGRAGVRRHGVHRPRGRRCGGCARRALVSSCRAGSAAAAMAPRHARSGRSAR